MALRLTVQIHILPSPSLSSCLTLGTSPVFSSLRWANNALQAHFTVTSHEYCWGDKTCQLVNHMHVKKMEAAILTRMSCSIILINLGPNPSGTIYELKG